MHCDKSMSFELHYSSFSTILRTAFLLEKQHNTNKFKMSVNVKVELKVPDNSYVEWSDAHRYLQQHGHAPQVAFSLNLTGSLSSRK